MNSPSFTHYSAQLIRCSFVHLQVSAGQHMHLNGDLKNNVSVAAQQGIFFNHTNKAQPQNVNMNAGPGCNSNVNNPNNSQSSHAPQPNNNSQSMTINRFSILELRFNFILSNM